MFTNIEFLLNFHVEALPMRKSNEYKYKYGLLLYNAMLILDIFCSRQNK